MVFNINTRSFCGLGALLGWFRGGSYTPITQTPVPSIDHDESDDAELASLLSSAPNSPTTHVHVAPMNDTNIEVANTNMTGADENDSVDALATSSGEPTSHSAPTLLQTMFDRFPKEIVILIYMHTISKYDYIIPLFAPTFSPTWEGRQNPEMLKDMRVETFTQSSPPTYSTSTDPIYIQGHIANKEFKAALNQSGAALDLELADRICYRDAINEARRQEVRVFSIDRGLRLPFLPRQHASVAHITIALRQTHCIFQKRIIANLPFKKLNPVFDRLAKDLLHKPGVYDYEPGNASPRYSRLRHIVLHDTRVPMVSVNPGVQSMEKWYHFIRPYSGNDAQMIVRLIELEQALWLFVDWEKLHRLESLYINLSFVRQTTNIDVWNLLEVAAEDMCRHLNLDLLVIYGLKTGRAWINSDGQPFQFSGEQSKNETTQTHQGQSFVNWVHVFQGAVRPGGRLILLDERCVPEIKEVTRDSVMRLGATFEPPRSFREYKWRYAFGPEPAS